MRQMTRRLRSVASDALPTSLKSVAGDALVRQRVGPPKPWYIIDPRNHPRLFGFWDVVLTLALTTVVMLTPFETAFLELEDTLWLIFVINRAIDIVFMLDIMLQFVVMRQMSTADGTRWVSNPRQLWLHYLKTARIAHRCLFERLCALFLPCSQPQT